MRHCYGSNSTHMVADSLKDPVCFKSIGTAPHMLKVLLRNIILKGHPRNTTDSRN